MGAVSAANNAVQIKKRKERKKVSETRELGGQGGQGEARLLVARWSEGRH